MVSTCKEVHRRIVLNTPLALFINNAWVEPVRNNRMSVVDPADETVITTQCPAATAEDVDAAVQAATKAFAVWGRTTGAYVGKSPVLRPSFTLHSAPAPALPALPPLRRPSRACFHPPGIWAVGGMLRLRSAWDGAVRVCVGGGDCNQPVACEFAGELSV